MASDNETVEDVCEKWLGIVFVCTYESGMISSELDSDELKEKILRAYKREQCKLLASIAKQREINKELVDDVSELSRLLKVAEDALTKLQDRLVSSVYDGTIDPHEALRITENALSAIREEGGSKINAKCVACPVQANCSGCPRGEYCDESNCQKMQGGAK